MTGNCGRIHAFYHDSVAILFILIWFFSFYHSGLWKSTVRNQEYRSIYGCPSLLCCVRKLSHQSKTKRADVPFGQNLLWGQMREMDWESSHRHTHLAFGSPRLQQEQKVTSGIWLKCIFFTQSYILCTDKKILYKLLELPSKVLTYDRQKTPVRLVQRNTQCLFVPLCFSFSIEGQLGIKDCF